MKIGDKLNYFGKTVEVVEFNSTHCVIKFEDGTKICTNKNTFFKNENTNF
jgi:hypothetical protein